MPIRQNTCFFQGEVISVTVHAENFAVIMLRTIINELAANGSWVNNAVDIPVMTTDTKKVAVIAKNIDAGRELFVDTYYKTWQDPAGNIEHGFMIKRWEFGGKKYEPKAQVPPLQ
jgi:hypothetical protein